MAGMGPPPTDPSKRRRRNATVATTKLPAEGRTGEVPPWPLIPDVTTKARRDLFARKVERLEDDLDAAAAEGNSTDRIEYRLDAAQEKLAILEAQLAEQERLELSLWTDLWGLPQAVQWERLSWMRDVAQYVRHKVLAELGDLNSAKEARQWSDRLGLTPLAMLRLRWEVVADEVAAQRERTGPAKSAARRRLKVVDPDAAAGG